MKYFTTVLPIGHSPKNEKLLEQSYILGQHLSNLCRVFSNNRSVQVTAEQNLQKIENYLASGFFIDSDHFEKSSKWIEEVLSRLESHVSKNGCSKSFKERVNRARNGATELIEKPPYLRNRLDGRSLMNVKGKDLLEEVCQKIVTAKAQNATTEELLASIVKPYIRNPFPKNHLNI